MKIAVRGGHNYLSTGCTGLIDEVTENRKVTKALVEQLKAKGHTVVDVTPFDCDSYTDLNIGVSRANEIGADIFLSIHFNKAYDSYNGAIGTETWIFPNSSSYHYAQKISDNIGKLGFRNRGVKTSSTLYELKRTSMKSIIVEVCFVEATKDVDTYNRVGYNAVAKAIAQAV